MKYLLILAGLLLSASPQDTREKESWKLTIKPMGKVHRPGKPLLLKFTVENPTDGEMDLAWPADYTEGLQITDPDGKVIKTYGKTKDIKSTFRSDGRGFIGRTADISSAFKSPEGHEGWYTIRWKLGDVESNQITVFVMPDYIAELETNHGTIKVEFFPEIAPYHVMNFIKLTRSKFYDGTRFHRIIAKFMMQGGAPKDPTKEPRQRLNAEFSNRKHRKGTLSMARQNDPNSATCQFFFCFAATAHLDGKYTIFGQITDGEDVLDEIEKVATDHNPCKGCKAELPPGPTQHCGRPGHHSDKPTKDVILKKVTLKVRKRK